MSILGIVAEYDPFHRGHGRHLEMARERVQPDYTYVMLSGCFKQRGDLALLTPYDRARCALAQGADAVFALPTAWTIRDAEHYALGAVSLLWRLGATHLAFGAETEDLTAMRRIAETLEQPTGAFREAMRRQLDTGVGYPRALSRAMEEIQPGAAGLLDQPNNTLGICYLRAMLRLGAEMEPVLIPRTGGYHADRIDPEAPSATAIREALLRGAYGQAYEALPEITRSLIREAFLAGRIPREETLSQMLISRLRSMPREELAGLPDVSEGLEDRLKEAAGQARSREELIERVSGKRYPKARIRRICAWALLGATAEEIRGPSQPEKAVLLGLRSRPEMTALWREQKDLMADGFEDPLDLSAWRIWAQCAGQADTLPWTERIVRVH